MSEATFRVGAAVADITPAAGVAMGGYGARKGVAEGVRDPLHARAVVIDDGTATLAIVVCDLVGVGPDIVEGARALAAEQCGIAPEHVLIAATHTHSGPGAVRTGDDRGYTAVTAAKVAGAIRMAHSARQPARLKWATTPLRSISQNRRDPAGPIEETARVLVAETLDGLATIATVVAYACHATVFEADNLDLSADFPGAACAFIERELGGVAVYLQGAAGDINPVWIRHDAVEVDRIGGIVGAATTRAALEVRPLGATQRVVNLSWSEDLDVAPEPGGAMLAPGALAAASTRLSLPVRPLPTRDEIGKQIKLLEVELEQVSEADRVIVRRIQPKLGRLRMEWLFAGRGGRAAGAEEVEVQVLRLDPDTFVVALPGEFLVTIGHEIAAQAGVPRVVIAGYANGYVGYVPRAEDFPHGGYEVGCARFEPEAAQAVVGAAVTLIASLRANAGARGPEPVEARETGADATG